MNGNEKKKVNFFMIPSLSTIIIIHRVIFLLDQPYFFFFYFFTFLLGDFRFLAKQSLKINLVVLAFIVHGDDERRVGDFLVARRLRAGDFLAGLFLGLLRAGDFRGLRLGLLRTGDFLLPGDFFLVVFLHLLTRKAPSFANGQSLCAAIDKF